MIKAPTTPPVIKPEFCGCGAQIFAYHCGICNNCHNAHIEKINAPIRCAYTKCGKIIKKGKYCNNWGKCEAKHALQLSRERRESRKQENEKITLTLF